MAADRVASFDVVVPACHAEVLAVAGNHIRQQLIPAQEARASQSDEGWSVSLRGGEPVRLIAGAADARDVERCLLVGNDTLETFGDGSSLASAKWTGARDRTDPQTVLDSLEDAFRFRLDDHPPGRPGLRQPQLGAVHAVLGYWSTSTKEPATVVMPTGTGKTETMLALFCVARIQRLLVVVPSDALRDQIGEKFEALGLLQELKVVSDASHRPCVGRIRKGFKDANEAAIFAEAANVIVTTPQALTACSADARQRILQSCSNLFIDEAHHVGATSWRQLRDDFTGKPVVQFTATPFREDGRHLGGRVIYAFPLGEAQAQGYFSEINFVSVLDLDNHDEAVAERAVKQLREDIANGHDHLIMARVQRIGRAADLLPIYEQLAGDLKPVVLHSTLRAKDRRAARAAIDSRESRIVICVNMLGEGFDLPALKVAAIHDPHKSLGVTLQFVGRFARTSGNSLGNATVVVGRPERGFDPVLRRLYAEDADWNKLIRDLSEGAVAGKQELSDFEAAFGSLPDEVAMHSLLPRMSTVVYRTSIHNWDPLASLDVFPEERLLTAPIAVNLQDAVAWFVTEDRREVKWGELRTVEEVSHDLYVLYWNKAKQLLYINSSNTSSHHEDLAHAVGGPSATRITGETVYRVMAQMKRLVPTNVGLLDIRNRSRRFSMHVGADVAEGFPVAEAQTKTKTNIFAYGFEDGVRASIGASLKGRVWSYRVANTLKEWIDWCDHIGAKLIDTSISVDEVMKDFIRPETVEARPPYVALAIEWPWQVFANMSEELCVSHAGTAWPVIDVDLTVVNPSDAGPIEFTVSTEDWSIDYTLTLTNGEMKFAASGADARIVTARTSMSLADFFTKNGLFVYFDQEAVVSPGALLLKPDRTLPPFDTGKLQAIDWTGILLNVESQGATRRQDSVQARMIQEVSGLAAWDIVLDDDGSGEVADVVALRVEDQRLVVHLTHCKYVHGGQPRAQVVDLYEVCGQAQKSVIWKRNTTQLMEYLIRRERQRLKKGKPSGFMAGTASDLYSLADQAALLRPEFTVAIAQPGLSAASVSAAQLQLLAATEVYVQETIAGPFEVYCSA